MFGMKAGTSGTCLLHHLSIAMVFALAWTGCGNVPPSFTEVDGGVLLEDGTFAPYLELGSGALRFAPLEDGSVVEIIHGPQGGYHVEAAVRLRPPMNPEDLLVRVNLYDGDERLGMTDYQVDLTPAGSYFERAGILVPVRDGPAASGKTLRLTAEATDLQGRHAFDARTVIGQQP